MVRTRIFDAHHHLWDLGTCRYPWLEARGVKRFFGDPTPIQKNYLVSDFLRDAGEFDLAGSTHIQVGVAEEDVVKETRWLQSVSAAPPRLPSAIVAFADLTRPDLEAHLDEHRTAKGFRGVRQIIGRHPGEDRITGSGGLLDTSSFSRGLAILGARRLTFDLQLTAAQYDRALDVFARAPELRFAICHFASPWGLSKDGFSRWADAMARFAELPGAHMKFSGFGMFKPDWTVNDIRPFVETALELFGPARCMSGSNFPVDKLYGDYGRIWRALDEIVPRAALFEQIALKTGATFYGVPLAS